MHSLLLTVIVQNSCLGNYLQTNGGVKHAIDNCIECSHLKTVATLVKALVAVYTEFATLKKLAVS